VAWAGQSIYRSDPGPSFPISTYEAPLEELERIVSHPAVIAEVERRPSAPLLAADHPPLQVPSGADRLRWRPRTRPAPIVDVFPFGMELDLLEIRLHELGDLVDAFVIAEAPHAYGCMRKPMYLQRNWDRFEAFHHKIVRLEIDNPEFATLYPGRRLPTDWAGDFFHRAEMWRRVRRIGLAPETVVLAGDADELLPRSALYLLKHFECPLPMVFVLPTLRYTFRWHDRDTLGNIIAVTPSSFPHLDQEPTFWQLPGMSRFAVRGAAHYTSFYSPTLLIAKFAMTTDWDRGIEVLLRNEHGETARMVDEGRWMNRALTPYDPEADPLGLVPLHARVNRDRYPRFWS
jgi:hypothetical protein